MKMSHDNVVDILYDMCRLCLERVGRYNLFSNEFTQIFAECTGVQVVMGDELPESICAVCMERLHMCKALRALAVQSDARLRQLRDGNSSSTTESDTDSEFMVSEIHEKSPEKPTTNVDPLTLAIKEEQINEDFEFTVPEHFIISQKKPTTSVDPLSHATKEQEQTNAENSSHNPRIRVREDIFDGKEDKSAAPKSNQIEKKSEQQKDGSKIVSQSAILKSDEIEKKSTQEKDGSTIVSQLLESSKLRLEMLLEQQRKEARLEAASRDDQRDETRTNASKKVKILESQLETEHGERNLLLRERDELARRLSALEKVARAEKQEQQQLIQRLKRDLKRYRTLLRDAPTMLEQKEKKDSCDKAQIRQLKNQITTSKSNQIDEKSVQQNEDAKIISKFAGDKASTKKKRTKIESEFTGEDAPTNMKRPKIDSEVSGLNKSEGDVSQFLREILEDDDSFEADLSEGEDVVSHFGAGKNFNPILAEEMDVAEEITVQVIDEFDDFYHAEDFALDEYSAFNIENMPIVCLNEEGTTLSMEEPMNVGIMDQTIGPEIEADHHSGGNHVDSNHSDQNVIVKQVDPGSSDEEWSPSAAIAQRGARGRSRSCLNLRDDTAVRAKSRRGRGRGRPLAAERVWRTGDRLAEVCATGKDISAQITDQLQIRGRGSSVLTQNGKESDGRANEDDAYEQIDKLSHNEGIPDDVLKEYKRFCESDAVKFEWKSMESFQGAKEPFQVDRTGPTRIFQYAYNTFREYWDDAILQHIVDATNVHGDAIPEAEKTFHKNWYHTNTHEILVLFAFWIMLGVIRMPSIKSCFSNEAILKTNIFRTMFTEGRYFSLNRALRFALNMTVEHNPNKLRHLRPILTHLNRKFKECYVPCQDICISVKKYCHYIKSNAKYGINAYELCESDSGYLWSLFMNTGNTSDTELSDIKTTKIALKLIHPLLGKGHQLFMDSVFSSPVLARFLKSKKTDCVGTLSRNRKHIPPLISKYIVRPGSYIARHADDVVVLSQTDSKPLIVMSTHHGTRQIQTKERPGRPSQYKLVAERDYNIGMGGVNKKDEMLEPYLVEKKQCLRWLTKCFKRLLNVSVSNSLVLVKKSGGKTDTGWQIAFRLELVKDILERHMRSLPKSHRGPVPRADVAFPPTRFVCDDREFHSIKKIDPPEEKRKQGFNHNVCRQCRWCSDRNRERARTAYECTLCKVPLCIEPCFALFHTRV